MQNEDNVQKWQLVRLLRHSIKVGTKDLTALIAACEFVYSAIENSKIETGDEKAA